MKATGTWDGYVQADVDGDKKADFSVFLNDATGKIDASDFLL
ncbi:MAG: hypothetical protein U1E59_11895 [Amaricoccus sp.]